MLREVRVDLQGRDRYRLDRIRVAYMSLSDLKCPQTGFNKSNTYLAFGILYLFRFSTGFDKNLIGIRSRYGSFQKIKVFVYEYFD